MRHIPFTVIFVCGLLLAAPAIANAGPKGGGATAFGAGAGALPGGGPAGRSGAGGGVTSSIGGKSGAAAGDSGGQTQLKNATKAGLDTEMSSNLQYLQLQSQMQNENRSYTAVSNIMKSKNGSVKKSIGNVR